MQLQNLPKQKSSFIDLLNLEIGKSIVGQKYMIERLLIGLLAQGHVLLEGVPGLAKTLAIKSLAQAINGKFSRIQFTPDLLPADVVGTMIYNQQQNQFQVRKGPIFANFVLADEIYEYINFTPEGHFSIGRIPELKDRVITDVMNAKKTIIIDEITTKGKE